MLGDAMDTDTNHTPIISGMPEIFEFQFMPSDVQTLLTEILDTAPVSQVFDAFSEHIGANIEPLGWKAIWKPTSAHYPEGTSFRVNVVDVYYQTLEASVVVSDMIFPKQDSLSSEQLSEIQPLLSKTEAFTVPLIDLFVISESKEDAQFYNTAYLVELTRFFYKNVWRPWDDLDERGQDDEFVPTRMGPRLKLLWEMKNGIISKSFIKRFDRILSEAFAVREKMNSFNTAVAVDPNADENAAAEDGASEMEAAQYMRWKMRLQDLEREMKIIEDPHLRSLYHTILPEQVANEADDDGGGGPSIHLVSKKFTTATLSAFMSKLVKLLGMNNSRCTWPIKVHQSVQKALASSNSGDVIYLSTGVYNEPFAWIEKDVEIIGVDDDVQLLSHQDSGDVFLFVNSQSCVKLSNLTIKANHQLNNLIVVRRGRLLLDRCKLDCNNLVANKTILVISDEASVDKQSYTEVLNHNSSLSESY